MEIMNDSSNKVKTICGHEFHCSCLLQNAAHNGFSCPYCREVLAKEVEEEDEEDEEDEDEWFEQINLDNSLTSFRMFHQRINEEEIEEEEIEEEDEEGQENHYVDYITDKLLERGISYEDLIKSLLFIEHNISLRGRPFIYERKSRQIYENINSDILGYMNENPN